MEMQNVTVLSDSQISDMIKSEFKPYIDSLEALDGLEMGKPAVLASVTNFKPFGLPFGDVAVGGLSAMTLSYAIDLAMKPVREKLGTRIGDGALKASAAYLANRWGAKLLGPGGAKAATFILTWEAFESLFPEVTTWVVDHLPAPTGATTSPDKQITEYSPPAPPPASRGVGPIGGGVDYYAVQLSMN
jgi:hypothetical protein